MVLQLLVWVWVWVCVWVSSVWVVVLLGVGCCMGEGVCVGVGIECVGVWPREFLENGHDLVEIGGALLLQQ